MEQVYKIKNPKTNKTIRLYGNTYNRLIKNGEYTEEFLLSLPRIEGDIRINTINQFTVLPTELQQEIFRQI